MFVFDMVSLIHEVTFVIHMIISDSVVGITEFVNIIAN